MDTPENNAQVSDEANSQVPFDEINMKTDSSIEDNSSNQNTTTNANSETLHEIPLQTPGEYENQLIINEDTTDHGGSIVPSVSLESYIEGKSSEETQGTEHEAIEEIAVQDNSIELETISMDSGSVDQLIVTTLSEVISSDNATRITTACVMQTAPDNITNISELAIPLGESCANVGVESEKDSLKQEESTLDSSSSVLDTSLPSFIGEIDESVSLPPAEPLILEDNSAQNISEKVEEIVPRKLIVNDIITESLTVKEIVDENVTSSETVAENITVNDIVMGNLDVMENKILKQNETIPKNVGLNEIELSEQSQTEIITTESNIQYTVLPPGENSVYQEDGTLVVEYPLDTTEISQNQSVNVGEFIETSELNIAESAASSEIHNVEIVGNLLKEENIIDMVKAREEENKSMEVDTTATPSENNEAIESRAEEKKQVGSDKIQPKRRGRRAKEGIPPHIVGHPIDKPAQDVINGKGLKPRLGVKIPYRKLASQIVSTSELQNHIVERARLKEEARTESDKTNLFTKKLTHRLAQSLSGLTNKDSLEKKSNKVEEKKTPDEDINIIENILAVIPSTSENSSEQQPTNPIEFVEQIVNEDTGVLENAPNQSSENEAIASSSESIENAEIIFANNMKNSTNIESNSDLIAILEGDGDESSPIMSVPNVIEIVETSESNSEIKAIEKEISLTDQKSSNPTVPPVKEKKFFKSRDSRMPEISKEKVKDPISKTKQSYSNDAPKTKIVTVKSEEFSKANIFDIESTSVTRDVKGAEMKNDQEKSSDVKGKRPGTVIDIEPQLKPAMVLKTYTRKRKSNDVATPEPPKKPLIIPSPSNQPNPKIDCVIPTPPNVYITKSSRVIKKKVIWDPDEAMPSVRNQSKILSKIEATVKTTPPTKVTASSKQITAKLAEKKIPEKEKQGDQSKIIKPIEKKGPKTIQDEKDNKVIDKPVVKKTEKQEVAKKNISKSNAGEKTTPQNKIVITSSLKISPGKSPKKSSKRLSEIDKLLMDEGAVNMLYDINNSEDQKRRVSGRAGTTPTDKAQTQKELLNRTLEIKNELTQVSSIVSSTPKALRKKEAPLPVKKEKEVMQSPTTISRKMSKDSTKSSTHSAPPSPAAFTPAEASRIIRRHSSSSFSSNDGLVQDESLDSTVEKDKEKQNKKKDAHFEKPIPMDDVEIPQEEQSKGKTTKKRTPFSPEALARKKVKRDESMLANGEPAKPTEIVIKSEPGIVTGALKTDPTKAFTVIKMNKHYMINLTYSGDDNYLTVQLLRDLTVTLKELERTRNCSVVSINSQGPAFCLGIDYKGLVESDDELRDKKITEMSLGIRDFLRCLLNFSKIIVAGVKGDCIGLGVTMLPLFDMIVATDTASFCTPYAKIGCPPEAGFLLSIPYQSNHALASELLYTAQRMNADEAQRRGLVTKLFWPEKFDSEFRTLLSHISNLSKPALMVTKKQLRQAHNKTDSEILNNCKLLKKFWGSEECQKNFVNYNALTFDIDH